MISPIQEVMARVIRLTRVQDNSYIIDMREWIAEAMGIMKTRFSLIPKHEDIVINFHKGKLPRDCDTLEAVEIGGHRLKKYNGVVESHNLSGHHSDLEGSRNGTTNGFQFLPQFFDAPPQQNPQENSVFFTQDNINVNRLPEHHEHWYNEDVIGYITTSMKTGRLRVHYDAMPVDQDGYPLVPDNENFKQAIYYYCRAAMIGAGFEDKIFNYDKIMSPNPKGYFWLFAERAIGEMIYPDVNTMEYKLNNLRRLIPDENYFDKFFGTPEPEMKYGYSDSASGFSPGSSRTFLNDGKKFTS